MEKLENINGVGTNDELDIFNAYLEDVQDIVEQIRKGLDIETCRCSYYPLRSLVEMAIKGEIDEKYRLILNGNESLQRDLVY